MGYKTNPHRTRFYNLPRQFASKHRVLPPAYTWKSNQFKALGINFSINTRSFFNLNFKTKLNQIETTLNCWRARNLSLIGKILKLFSCHNSFIFFLFYVLKFPRSFLKILIRFFIDLFGMGETTGSKERICVISMSIVALK